MNFIAKHKKTFLYLLCLIIIVAGVVLYKYYLTRDKISYITEEVRRQDIKKVINATGEVRAVELVTVGAQASGKIEKIHVTIGQLVKRGDLIAEIDATTQQNEINTNGAKINSYEAQLARAKTSLKIAEKQYKRMKELFKKTFVSAAELEGFENTYEEAKSKVTEIEAQLRETKIALSTAETTLAYTKITAPMDGTVVSIAVKPGQTVNAAMNTPTIVQIADLSSMEIIMEISEGDISNIKPGVKVTYATLTDLGNPYETTLKSIDPGLTLLTNAKYTEVVGSTEAVYYYGRLVVPNRDGKLRIGMTTQNVIHSENASNVLAIPSIAVRGEGNDKYVEVLTKSGVEKRPIVSGISDGINLEIKKGVTEREKVVITRMSSAEISEKASKTKKLVGF